MNANQIGSFSIDRQNQILIRSMAIRAATYSRYSDDGQRETSIVDQQRNCKQRADAEGWVIDLEHEFADYAISGSDSSRPQYQAMLRSARAGEFQVLLIDDLSRLARDSLEAERTIRSLEFHGIRIISSSDGYDSTLKSRKITRGFKNLMNETFLDDLRDRVHRGLTGQALRGHWCGGRPYGYKLKQIVDRSRLDAYGQPTQIGTQLEIDEQQALVVREIFEKYIVGQSYRAIAADLNERGVPSAGTTWARKKHRAVGWMGSSVRVILMNRLYTGELCWNKTRFVRNPETEHIVRQARPRSDWIISLDESRRIISDERFAKAQARSELRSNADGRLKRGGKLRYLLSGLLQCHACGAHFVVADKEKYACSSYVNGGVSACSNKARVRRDVLERRIIGPITDEMLDPERLRSVVAKLQKQFSDRRGLTPRHEASVLRELTQLDARLDRLRERLRKGDPDIEPDELQMAIDWAQMKRQQLAAPVLTDGSLREVLTMLLKLAGVYREQVVAGLNGNSEATARARSILRELIGVVMIKAEGDQV